MQQNKFLIIFILLWLYPSLSGAADSNNAVSWNQLSNEEQQILKPFQERWDSLPSDRRANLQQGAKRWKTMTPEQQAQARQRYQHFRQMPPEDQERLRRRGVWFKNLPPERRAELREKWKNMTPVQRQEFKKRRQRDDLAEGSRHNKPSRSQGMEQPARTGPR